MTILSSRLATNAPGEVAALSALAQPAMAVITSIAEEHLEGLGDLHGVAAEELSVLDHISPGGFAAVNVDWSPVHGYLPEQGIKIATFGRAEQGGFADHRDALRGSVAAFCTQRPLCLPAADAWQAQRAERGGGGGHRPASRISA